MRSRLPYRLSVVFEFAGARGHMMHALVEQLEARMPELRVRYIGGPFKRYRPGGLRLTRLANLVWVYARTAGHLILSRPDAVLVQSAPPGIQLWTMAWAYPARVPVFCWLMDYHPEMEARGLDRRGFGVFAKGLRLLDRWLMPKFSAIVTIDEAMAELARSRSKSADVLLHPTWSSRPEGLIPVRRKPGSGSRSISLVYSGNLGVAHDLTPLRRLLAALVRHGNARIVVIGGSAEGTRRFRSLGEDLGVTVQTHPRVAAYADLGRLYEETGVDAGIVLLSRESAGTASPSKFSGYIDFGLPVIYLGPPRTNAAKICAELGGGFWLEPDALDPEVEACALALLDPAAMSRAAAGASAASEYFAAYNEATLADVLEPRLRLATLGA